MPYKDPIKQREAVRRCVRAYRQRHENEAVKQRNRLAYLEMEVERLQKCLEHVVKTTIEKFKTLQECLFLLPQSSGD